MIYNATVDGGNSGLKVMVEGTHKTSIPNVMANPSGIDYTLGNNSTEGVGIDKLDVTVCMNFDKGSKDDRFLLGRFAEPFQARNRANTDKSKDIDLAKSMVTALAYAILKYREKAGEISSQRSTFTVNLATGLPYHEWKNEQTRAEFANKLTGNHLIKFNHPFFNELEIELIVQDTYVFIEGEAGVHLKLCEEGNEFVKMEDNELIETVVVGLDIGGGTTEIIGEQFYWHVLDENEDTGDVRFRTMPNLTKGIPFGVGNMVYDQTISDIEKAEKVDKLIRRDIEKAFTKQGIKNGKPGHLVGTSIDITKYFIPHAQSFAKMVGQEFYSLYNNTNTKNKVKKIYLYGGGSLIDALVNEFKAVLVNDGFDPKIIVTMRIPDPVFANCFGYYLKLLKELEIQGENYEGAE